MEVQKNSTNRVNLLLPRRIAQSITSQRIWIKLKPEHP